MIHEAILQTKRCEIDDCRINHARKLRELWFATVGLAGGRPTYHPAGASDPDGRSGLSEDDFLAANDLSKERYFDFNTLAQVGGELAILPLPSPSLPSEAASPSPVQDDVEHAESTRAEDETGAGASPHHASTPEEDEDELSSTQRSSRSTQAGTPATRETVSGLEEHGVDATTVLDPEKVAEDPVEPDDGDVSMVDVGAGPSADGDEIQTPAPATAAAVSYKDRLEAPVESLAKAQPISPPSDAEQAESSGLKPASAATRPSQVPTSPATPITPDAQIQLEASQATRPSDVVAVAVAAAAAAAEAQRVSLNAASEAPMVPEVVKAHPGVAKEESRNLGDNLGESKLAARRRGLSPDLKNTAMTHETSKDLFLSQRPPMRIDTSISRHRPEAQTPASATTSKPAQSAVQTSPPERMTTRVSSGVLRHKSVSEILGETPRIITPYPDKTPTERTRQASHGQELGSHQPLIASHLASSPDPTTFRSRLQEIKDKDRTKLSTVVLAGSPAGRRDGSRSIQTDKGKSPERNKDYLVTLFTAQASAQVPNLDHLVKSAHKALSTRDHYVGYREAQDCRILKRIYHLQNSNRWSLRQLERSAEPERTSSHWDNVLGEMKWLRSDFREERKWRTTMARTLADWCAEFVNSPVRRRRELQVEARGPAPAPPPVVPDSHNTPVSLHVDTGCAISDTPPELVPSADDDPTDEAEDDLPRMDLARMSAPATLFSLGPKDIIFDLDRTPASDNILAELPMYQAFESSRGVKRSHDEMLDHAWKKPIVPVTKYATGRLVLPDREPARKRSRYEYEDDAEDVEDVDSLSMQHGRHAQPLPPEQDDVALFNPENKHIIERLHLAHAFRPPSEFPMPSQSFFEARFPSQWTLAEDGQLRELVKEYEYNWSLVASCLSGPSPYTSGPERRTPWECFERWVSFEGLPGDMARHAYFRTWNSRREGARQHLEQQAQNPQPGPHGQLLARRKSSEPMGVERRRNNKYLALIMAMSKVAKKREVAAQKQQHAMRKAAEPMLPRPRPQSPRELSALRYKADCERRELYRQQLAASQRVAMAQKAAQQVSQQQAAAAAAGLPPSRNGRPPSMGGPPMSALGQNGLGAGQRPSSSSQQQMMSGLLPNGAQLANGQLGVRGSSGIPQAQMQAYLQSQAAAGRLPTPNGAGGVDNTRVILEASRLSEQQRLMQQQRQYQAQANGLNGVPSASQHLAASMGIPMSSTAALMAASAQGANGKLSPVGGLSASQGPVPRPSSSSPQGPAATPVQQQQHHPGQLSSGIVPVLNQISSHLKAQNPHASPEQIKQWATATLSNSFRQQQQQQSQQHHQQQQQQQQQQQLSQAQQQAVLAASMGLNGASGGLSGLNGGGVGVPQLSPQQQAAALAYNGSVMNSQLYAQYMRSQQASQQQSRLGVDGNNGHGLANGGGGGGGSERNSVRPESRGQTATPQQQQQQQAPPQPPHKGGAGGLNGSSQSPPQMPPQLNGSVTP